MTWRVRYPSAPYVVPFVAFLLFLTLSGRLGLNPAIEVPVWTIIMGVICFVCWPREIPIAPRYWILSSLVGAAVFLLWIGPDKLWPSYRSSSIFSFAKLGIHSPAPAALEHVDKWMIGWRFFRAAIIVPIVEELFWRAWLMRWLVDVNFRNVPLGKYAASAFWITALLFASEHGQFWDVGLIAGIVYNWWMLRTRSVADCVLMHSVTNAILSVYVIIGGHWQYWG